jgi:hypothetical protein
MRPIAPGLTSIYTAAWLRLRRAINDMRGAIRHVDKPACSPSELHRRRQHLLELTEAFAAALAEEMTS